MRIQPQLIEESGTGLRQGTSQHRQKKKKPQLIAAIFTRRCFVAKVWICVRCSSQVARMGERYNIHSQLEHLQSKYIGTGHADTTKFEWMVNQHRDSCSSYMGHHDLLNIFAIAENESKARVRFNIMEKMLQPCGPPPDKPED